MKTMNKKGFTPFVQNMVMGLAVIGIILAVVLIVLGKMGDMATTNGYVSASIAINETADAVSEIPGWLGILVIIGIAGVALMFVYGFGREKAK